MNAVEFGKENSQVIILLHGGGLSWWNYREAASLLSVRYHVVIPLLDGHAGSGCAFITIEDTAEKLKKFIEANFGGKVFAIGGLSLGGQILTQLLSAAPDICQYAVMESVLVIPMRLTNLLVGPMVSMSYGLIQMRWFSKIQFQQLHMRPDLFEEYYRDTCQISKKDMTAILKSNSSYTLKHSLTDTSAKILIAVGAKELPIMKRSASMIHHALPGSRLHILPGFQHGDLSINHPEEYVKLLKSVMEE